MRRTPFIPALALVLFLSVVVFVVDGTGVFEARDLSTQDLLFKLRGTRVADDRVAIVVIDDETIGAYGQWPLPRDTYALLLEALGDARPSAVGFDLLFLDEKEDQSRLDLLLAAITGKYRNVVHAVTVGSSAAAGGAGRGASGSTPRDVVERERIAVPEVAEIALPFPKLAAAARAFGHVSVLVDEDGKIRRVPLMLRHRTELYGAMALRLVGIARGWPEPLEVRPSGEELAVATADGMRTFPVDRDGGVAFEFAGSSDAFPRKHSLLEVLQWYRDGHTEKLADAFRGRIVLVGVTAMGEAAADIGATPFSAATPLVYVHANLADALLRDRILRRVPPPLVHFASASLAAGLAIALIALPLAWTIASAALAFGFVAAGQYLLLTQGNAVVPSTATLLLVPGTYVTVTAYRLVFLERSVREWEPVLRAFRSFRGRLFSRSDRERESGEMRRIGPYRLEEMLGRGGMGEVWRASHDLLERPAAVKLIRSRALGMEDPAQALAALRRFEREVQATAGLRSVNTIEIYDFGVEDGSTFFYVMELLDGVGLDELVQRFGPLPPERAVHLLVQVCDSLDEAHQSGLVHRDIKPANVFACRKGTRVDHVKVLDFGLVKRQDGVPTDAKLTGQGALAGTPSFISPEQALMRADLDGRADLYSVGCLGYWLVTGMLVFDRKSPMEMIVAHVREDPTPVSRASEVPVPGDLEEVIMSCLAKDPGARPDSASVLGAAFRSCASHGQWTAERAGEWWRRHLPADSGRDRQRPTVPPDAETRLVSDDTRVDEM